MREQIDTDRLMIRPLEENDFTDFASYASDDELSYMFGWPQSKDIDHIRRIFERLLRGNQTYALYHKDDYKVIGHLTIVAPELPSDKLAILGELKGVTMAFAVAPTYQRQGIMTEVLTTMICTLFSEVQLDYIHCGHFEWNQSSQKLQEKLGFCPMGYHVFQRKQTEIKIIDNILYKQHNKFQ